jgi:hypothetical protein
LYKKNIKYIYTMKFTIEYINQKGGNIEDTYYITCKNSECNLISQKVFEERKKKK